jgi:hypothetical protein
MGTRKYLVPKRLVSHGRTRSYRIAVYHTLRCQNAKMETTKSRTALLKTIVLCQSSFALRPTKQMDKATKTTKNDYRYIYTCCI